MADQPTQWRPHDPQKFNADVLANFSNSQLARKWVASESTIKRYKRMLREGVISGYTAPVSTPQSSAETTTITGDKMEIYVPNTRICTYEELVAHAKVDTTIWECERLVINKWEVGAKDNDGNIQVEPLFQVKATFKKKLAIFNAKEDLATLLDDTKRIMKEVCFSRPTYKKPKNNILEISIPDSHFGRLTWGEECGEPYDLSIAKNVYFDALYDLLDKSSAYDVEQVLLVFGNDMMHVDNGLNTTTRGTQQNIDGRYQKIFRTVRQVAQQAVMIAREVAPVKALMVSGNHDWYSTFCLGDALDAVFDSDKYVEIDNTPTPRKYYQYGQNMLMFTHGNEEKHSDLPMIMAQERPVMWGETTFRECHIGHLHKKKTMSRIDTDESFGVRVRILPSLCTSDDWHTRMGYIGNNRSAESYIWNKEDGNLAQFVYTVK